MRCVFLIFFAYDFTIVMALIIKLQCQSMPGDACDHTLACPRTCKIPSTSDKLPVPTSLSTVQWHMPNGNFVVATATLVTVTFCFHNFALSYLTLN